MRSKEEVVAYEVTVDEKQNKVLVSVELQARRGREATHRVGASDVRQYLEGQGINAAELISGNAIHNNMSRALGIRTQDDLRADWVFAIAGAPVEEPPTLSEEAPAPAAEVVEEEVVVKAVKAAPKRRTRARKNKTGDKE